MNWMMTKIAAATIAAAIAIPSTAALAGHPDNRYDRGGLTKREAVDQVMRTFDRIDRNHNHKISRKEVKRYERRDHHRGSYRYARYDPYRYDTKRNLITLSNFRKYDRDHDGVIHRHEAKRSVKRRFERADRNNDGYLSKREIRRSGWYDFDYDYDWERGHDSRWDYEHERNRERDRHHDHDRDRDHNRDRDHDRDRHHR